MTTAITQLVPNTYDELISFRDGLRDEHGESDADLRPIAELLLARETRLLEERAYDAWLEILTNDCIYWMPHSTDSDPRHEVSYLLDDRRRILDRIAWMRTGWAHAQTPSSVTIRAVSNIESFYGGLNTIRVRASAVTWAWRRQELIPHPVGLRYLLVRQNDEWRIRFRIIQRVDADGAVRNLAFIL